MSVRRYRHGLDYHTNNFEMIQDGVADQIGEWVRFEDYAALEKQEAFLQTTANAMSVEIERLQAECRRLGEELSKRPLGVDEDPLTGRLR